MKTLLKDGCQASCNRCPKTMSSNKTTFSSTKGVIFFFRFLSNFLKLFQKMENFYWIFWRKKKFEKYGNSREGSAPKSQCLFGRVTVCTDSRTSLSPISNQNSTTTPLKLWPRYVSCVCHYISHNISFFIADLYAHQLWQVFWTTGSEQTCGPLQFLGHIRYYNIPIRNCWTEMLARSLGHIIILVHFRSKR
jgi:hypothetical protein